MHVRDDDRQPQLLPSLTLDRTHNGTKASYEADLADFNSFALRTTGNPLPHPSDVRPALIVAFIRDLADRRFRRETIRRRLVAISAWYKEHDIREDPRTNDKVQRAWKDVLDADDRGKDRRVGALENIVNAMLDSLDDDYATYPLPTQQITQTYLRDRALILVLYFGGLTRIEAATLHRSDIVRHPATGELLLKVNPTGEIVDAATGEIGWRKPRRLRLALLAPQGDPRRCPVHALTQWFAHAQIDSGYAFRGVRFRGGLTVSLAPTSIQRIVKGRLARIDEPNVDISHLTVHSLRIGRAATLAIYGKSDAEILNLLGTRDYGDSIGAVVRKGRALHGSSAVDRVSTI
jgi:integrase